MATSDVHGHRVPTGSDFAARKSLTDLSLSIMGGPKSVGSLAAANQYVTDVTAALSAAGLPPISADNPVYVSRSDQGCELWSHDGIRWTLVAKSVPPATTLKQYNSVVNLGAADVFIVSVAPWTGLSRAIVHYSLRIRPAGNAAGSVFVWNDNKKVPGSEINWHSDGTDRDQFVSGTILMAPKINSDIGLWASALGAGSAATTAGRATLQVSAY